MILKAAVREGDQKRVERVIADLLGYLVTRAGKAAPMEVVNYQVANTQLLNEDERRLLKGLISFCIDGAPPCPTITAWDSPIYRLCKALRYFDGCDRPENLQIVEDYLRAGGYLV